MGFIFKRNNNSPNSVLKSPPRKPQKRPPTYRDLKSLCRQTGLYDPFDFRDYLQTRLRRLKPETVKAIAKYHLKVLAPPELEEMVRGRLG